MDALAHWVRCGRKPSGRWQRTVFTPAASRLDYAFNDRPAGMAKGICKFAQGQSLLADPQTVKLHKLGFIEFGPNFRPESVDIIDLAARRHGNRDDCAHR